MDHPKIRINKGKSDPALLIYLNSIDQKYKSEGKESKIWKVKNFLFEPAKDYEKFKEKEITFKKN